MEKEKVLNVRTMASTAVLAAVAYVLAFFEFPVPFSPSFARMDLSDFPALIGSFAFGPLIGVLVELIKNLLQLMSSTTGGVGELANFLMGASYVVTAGLIYRMHKTNGVDRRYCRSRGNGYRGGAGELLYSASAFRAVPARGTAHCFLP